MKAAILESFGSDLNVQDIDIADPTGSEVLVEVKASGLCHSDLNVIQGGHPIPLPAVLGHEVAGIVRAVGPDVVSVRPGNHVVGCMLSHCGHCDDCISGHIWLCPNRAETRRSTTDAPRLSRYGQSLTQLTDIGGFAEQVLVDEGNLVAVPDDIPLDKAAVLGCGVITGAGAVLNVARIQVGHTVAVLGCGGVGLSAVQAASLAGALRVIAIDLQDAKLELARRFGATDVVNPGREDLQTRIADITGGAGVDAAFEVIGLKVTAQQAISITRRGGTTYLVGMQKPGTIVELDGIGDLLFGQKSVVGVYMGSSNFKIDIPRIIAYYRQGRFNLDDLVSETIDLKDINSGYAAMQEGRVARSVVVFD